MVVKVVLDALRSDGAVVDSCPCPVVLDRLLEVEVGSRIYVHLGVVVRMRIVDWGIGRLERDVAKPVDARDGSGMFSLTVHRQNGGILLAILSQF